MCVCRLLSHSDRYIAYCRWVNDYTVNSTALAVRHRLNTYCLSVLSLSLQNFVLNFTTYFYPTTVPISDRSLHKRYACLKQDRLQSMDKLWISRPILRHLPLRQLIPLYIFIYKQTHTAYIALALLSLPFETVFHDSSSHWRYFDCQRYHSVEWTELGSHVLNAAPYLKRSTTRCERPKSASECKLRFTLFA